MFKLTKTTLNAAKKLGMVLQIVDGEEIDRVNDALWIYTSEEDCEPTLFYNISDDGTLSFSSAFLPLEIKEELPATIFDQKKLREVLAFVHSQTM